MGDTMASGLAPLISRSSDSGSSSGARYSKLPVITGPVKLFCFPFQMGGFKSFEYYTVKLLAKENKMDFIKVQNTP